MATRVFRTDFNNWENGLARGCINADSYSYLEWPSPVINQAPAFIPPGNSKMQLCAEFANGSSRANPK